MAVGNRSVEGWNALAPSTRRRWIAAYGGSEDAALEAYRNGASLTREQRGHARTPERPIRALLNPTAYPRYVARHLDELNRLARERGEKPKGEGPRGPAARDYYDPEAGDYTWVVRPTRIGQGEDCWHASAKFRTMPEAQLWARQSGAPAGVVVVVDWGPEVLYRWEVWFVYPCPDKGKKRR